MKSIGIRREDKHPWEARVPLTPAAIAELVTAGFSVTIQPSTIRAFSDDDYRQAGADVAEDLSACELVLAVKEIPSELFRRDGAYLFFSHTIKGQRHNMPMLARLLALGCTLIDYERIVDESGRRLVFFGRHAGLAGMIDSLHVLGRRLAALGHTTSLADISLAHEYADLQSATAAVAAAGKAFVAPPGMAPIVVGFAGYGNVSQGAQEVFRHLPHRFVAPNEVADAIATPPDEPFVGVVYREQDLVERRDGGAFVLQEYYDHPERYQSRFAPHLRQLSMLINAIYWTEAYPRLVTHEWLDGELAASRLVAIGDISCDIDGAVICTTRATTPGAPAYVYDPRARSSNDGVSGDGVAMMTTDCLPCELPRESSQAFTEALLPFVKALDSADLTAADHTSAKLPAPLERAVIAWRGELTPAYAHLAEHLPDDA